MSYLFVYGTLRPGQVLWPMIEPAVLSSPVCTILPGYALIDSGAHYPIMVDAEQDDIVRGTILDIDPEHGAAAQVYNMEFGAGYKIKEVVTEAGSAVAFTWPWHVDRALFVPARKINGYHIYDFALNRELLGYPPNESALLEK